MRWARCPPLESLGEILEGEMRKKGREREKGKGERKEEEREKRGKEKKIKMEREKKGKLSKGRRKLKMEGKGMKMSSGPFSFFLSFFFCLSLFETTENCLGCIKIQILGRIF